MANRQSGSAQGSGSNRYRQLLGVLFSTTALFFGVDQVGKGWAFSSGREPAGAQQVFAGLYAGLQGRNNGGMLSLEGAGSPTAVWIFSLIVFILLGMVLRWAIVPDKDRWKMIDAAAGGLLLAGILGNQVDRLLLGYVRDYLVLASYPYQIFNSADLFMLLGAALLVGSLVIHRRALPAEAAAAAL